MRAVEIQRLLTRLGVEPYKGWGQNFLIDEQVPIAMAAAARLTAGTTVVEIGPGLGILTSALLATGATVTAVEVDRRLVAYLREQLPDEPRLRLIQGDLLALPLDTIVAADEPYVVVANLPYSITAAVLRHLLGGPHRPSRLVVMVQREVAERLTARPPAMSLLAVSVQLYGRPEIVLPVPAASFVPPPKVDSAVVALTVAPPPLPDEAHPAFFRLVAAGFSQRRKTLGNSLAAGLAQPREQIEELLLAAGIDPRRRAQTLGVDDWLTLFAVVSTPTTAPAEVVA